eukprot:TRINITY_DN17386_c0_g1_i1.p2 TRINITY_DN17386_c0_g1~~TRINITY_DN17386_c0_g1_i1.p2  ORF type:complete len:153 (-),score=62.27 TRINITY_DN17386_c0_g1_i1:140-598(-)
MSDEFDTKSAGADTFPLQCSAIKKNAYCVMKGRPCKVIDLSTSKTGKHGHAKVHMIGIDIFTSKKIEELCPSTHNMSVPVVNRNDYIVLDIDDGFVSVMTDSGEEKSDLKVPADDVGAKLEEDFEEGKDLTVSVIAAMGEEKIIAVKESSNK